MKRAISPTRSSRSQGGILVPSVQQSPSSKPVTGGDVVLGLVQHRSHEPSWGQEAPESPQWAASAGPGLVREQLLEGRRGRWESILGTRQPLAITVYLPDIQGGFFHPSHGDTSSQSPRDTPQEELQWVRALPQYTLVKDILKIDSSQHYTRPSWQSKFFTKPSNEFRKREPEKPDTPQPYL